jgi:hypothetical protein
MQVWKLLADFQTLQKQHDPAAFPYQSLFDKVSRRLPLALLFDQFNHITEQQNGFSCDRILDGSETPDGLKMKEDAVIMVGPPSHPAAGTTGDRTAAGTFVECVKL